MALHQHLIALRGIVHTLLRIQSAAGLRKLPVTVLLLILAAPSYAQSERLEFGTLSVGSAPVSVSLTNTYASAVVVASVQYASNTIPVVTRVSNVTTNSFDVRLQNPSGTAISAETVHYVVVEEGTWTIDGVPVEAQRYLSTVTDSDSSWAGQSQSYGQSYTSPVVLGQVMSENDAGFSVFWSQGGTRQSAPSSTTLVTGKTVAEDGATTRADELIGFIVLEAGHGTLGGVEYEAALGGSTVQGVGDAPAYGYTFNSAFADTPVAAVVTQAGMDGPNGGWAQLHGSGALTATGLGLSIDEDQIGDTERNHIAEEVAYIAFSGEPNTVPVAGDDTGGTAEDTPVLIGVLTNDSDGDGDTLSISAVTQPASGAVTIVSDEVQYAPAANFCGADSFSYTLSDGRGGTDTASVDVAVSCVNDAPVASDGSAATPIDTAVVIALSASDIDADALTYSVGTPGNGSLSGTAPNLTYTPDGGFAGTDSFTFTVNDGTTDSGTATVSIEVSSQPVGRLEFGTLSVGGAPVRVSLTNTYVSPVVVAGANNTGSAPLVTRVSNVSSSGFDVRLQNPSGGTVSADTVHWVVVEEGTWTIDGVPIEAQRYLSTVTDSDSSWAGQSQSYGQSYTNPVVLGQVMSENDAGFSVFWARGSATGEPPSSTTLFAGKTVAEDTDTTRADELVGFIVIEAGHGTLGGVEYEAALGGNSIQGAGNSPPYGYTFNSAFAETPQTAVVSLAGMNGTNGGWAQLHGSGALTATALSLSVDEDQIGDTERNHISEQVSYLVLAGEPNAAPVAGDDTGSTPEDSAVLIDVLTNDSDGDGDTLSVSALTQPSSGTVTIVSDEVQYVPAADFCGIDSFTYTLSDGRGGTDTASVDVAVSCVNDPPVANDDTVSTDENVAVSIAVLSNDTDADAGDTLSIESVGLPGNGTAVIAGTDILYTPAQDICGTDSFGYVLSDGAAVTDSALVSVDIACFNELPVANGQSLSTPEDALLAITLTGTDGEDDPLSYSVTGGPAFGALAGTAPDLTYTPNADFNGSDSFAFIVNDGTDDSAEAVVSISVVAQNDAPIADDADFQTPSDTALTVTLSASDVDGDTLTYSVGTPGGGSLTGTAPNLTYTPDGGFAGTDSFTFTVNDGTTDSGTATVSIEVSSQPVGRLEFGTLSVGSAPVSVSLTNTYASAVVVASVQYASNTIPVVTRVSNVTTNSFDVRLQNPSGTAISAETVHYVVVEEGTWTIDGVPVEAQRYLSTVTDSDSSWAGQSQSYGQSYTSPVVLGQVMSENDAGFSVFWSQGGTRQSAPSSTTLVTGKTVAEDGATTRADELIGFIVLEAGHGTLGGVEYEAALGGSTVQGVGDAPAYGYTFNSAFADTPVAAVVTQAGMDGPNGGWAQLHGSGALTATGLGLSIDEDQIGDTERNHIAEEVAYIAFASAFGNTPPTVTIALPGDGATFTQGDNVDFVATANDAEDDDTTLTAAIAWTSSVDGSIGTGGSFASASLSEGTHTIVAQVADSGNSSHSDSVTITIDSAPTDTDPVVTITGGGGTYTQGATVTLTATASDFEDGDIAAGLSWTSSLNGGLGAGSTIITSTLSLGTHTVMASVTDADNNTATDAVTVTINAPPATSPPTVTITAPATGSTFTDGANVAFAGTVADVQDDDAALTAGLDWSSNLDGSIGTGGGFTTATLSVGTHTVTASVTDSDGDSDSDAVTITVNAGGTSGRPNILYILVDDWGAEAASMYPDLVGDSGAVSTPNIEGLAANGIVFDNVWANPVCSPTRATVVSGRYGNRTGVLFAGDPLSSATTTSIWEYISASSPENYAMAAFGKWHLGTGIQSVIDHGLPEYRGMLGGGVSNYFDWSYSEIGGGSTQTTQYSTSAITDWAVEFVEERSPSEDPWFLYVPYNAPHGTSASTRFQVPPADLHSVPLGGLQPGDIVDTVPVYKAMVQALDTEIGRLLDALGPPGTPERDNTVIVFMGDNGTPAAVKDTGSGVRGSKSSVYEGGVRVPLIVTGAGVTRIGEREEALINGSDLYATFADLSGIPVSQIEDAWSITPLFADGSADTGRNYAFTEVGGFGGCGYTIRNLQHKLIFTGGTWALYDLINDPLESNNLYNDPAHAAVRSELEAELALIEANGPQGCF